jgi:hypothetical protein
MKPKIDPVADRAAELLGRFARLIAASLPSPTVAHLVRVAEAGRDHSQRLSARPDEHRMAQDFAAIAQALRIAESATDYLHRLEGVSLELRVMRDRIEGIGRTIVPPLDAADLPPGFARALGELDELAASLDNRITDLRRAKP